MSKEKEPEKPATTTRLIVPAADLDKMFPERRKDE